MVRRTAGYSCPTARPGRNRSRNRPGRRGFRATTVVCLHLLYGFDNTGPPGAFKPARSGRAADSPRLPGRSAPTHALPSEQGDYTCGGDWIVTFKRAGGSRADTPPTKIVCKANRVMLVASQLTFPPLSYCIVRRRTATCARVARCGRDACVARAWPVGHAPARRGSAQCARNPAALVRSTGGSRIAWRCGTRQ